ncbi:MAG: hypothetical protein AAGH40_05100 [Verrucomicrobiota bacterium]
MSYFLPNRNSTPGQPLEIFFYRLVRSENVAPVVQSVTLDIHFSNFYGLEIGAPFSCKASQRLFSLLDAYVPFLLL